MYRKISVLIFSLVLTCAGTGISLAGSDPGIPDTVKIEGGPLVVGQSVSLQFTIVNDELVDAYSLGFILDSLGGGGFAVFDSAVYINRLADPMVFSFRIETRWDSTNAAPPDSLLLGAQAMMLEPMPAGNEPIAELYFTGISPGTMTIDSGFFPPAAYFILVTSNAQTFDPQIFLPDIEVIQGNPLPTISLPSHWPQVVAGATVEFEVEGDSPVEFPVTLELVSLTGYDDETILPSKDPSFGDGNPAEFSWMTKSTDIGIWLATFEVCDSSGTCVTGDVVIQVVESPSQLLSFAMTETEDACRVTAMHHGNFDSDLTLEFAASGSGEIIPTATLAVYDYHSNGTFVEYAESDYLFPKTGLEVGYFNQDDNLDVVLMRWYSSAYLSGWFATSYFGDGNNGFDGADTSSAGHYLVRSTSLDEFTGDSYIDYIACESDNIGIYAGDGLGGFEPAITVPIGQTALSVSSSDFNGDGLIDLAVGTETHLRIYLATSIGNFSQAYAYSQTYGSLEIEVTNQGSDFDNDDIFDLCISTPSLGGAYSDMVVYLGNGDGSFAQDVIRTVRGQIFGNCVGDFDGDGELDIAYVNGARRYAAILFGDGSGSFDNEIRFAIPHENPRHINTYDVDLDGDLDLVVAANASDGLNSLFLLKNQLDPEGFSQKSFNISACDNAAIELTSQSGRVFNQIRNTMPSGDYFKRNINNNADLDDYGAINVVESGEYILTAAPKPNLPAGDNFTLEFVLDGELYRLAKDVPMSADGYNFNVSADNVNHVLPQSGKFIQANPPTFLWFGDGQFDFQLASDVEFTAPVHDVVVDGSMFALPEALAVSGTTTYYWRIKPHGAVEYDCLYVVNLMSGAGSAGDANGDDLVNVADAVFMINYIFREGAAPEPLSAGDANCDGESNVGDAVYLIQFIFNGGPPPVEGC